MVFLRILFYVTGTARYGGKVSCARIRHVTPPRRAYKHYLLTAAKLLEHMTKILTKISWACKNGRA
jgi:hypothetical protein